MEVHWLLCLLQLKSNFTSGGEQQQPDMSEAPALPRKQLHLLQVRWNECNLPWLHCFHTDGKIELSEKTTGRSAWRFSPCERWDAGCRHTCWWSSQEIYWICDASAKDCYFFERMYSPDARERHSKEKEEIRGVDSRALCLIPNQPSERQRAPLMSCSINRSPGSPGWSSCLLAWEQTLKQSPVPRACSLGPWKSPIPSLLKSTSAVPNHDIFSSRCNLWSIV